MNNSGTIIGVLGGGQLGRMLAMEARRMGMRVIQWTGGESSGAETLADEVITAPFDDAEALQLFIEKSDVVTVEFENIPVSTLEKIQESTPVYPNPSAIAICQNRETEKQFLTDNDIPTVPYYMVNSAEELAVALDNLKSDVIIKTAQFGYDGKGQLAVDYTPDLDAKEIWSHFADAGVKAIVEKKIDLTGEISVMVVRSHTGETRAYDPAENIHRNHILDLSIVPARLPQDKLEQAKEIAIQVAQALDYYGVIGVEFFIDQDNNLLVNEMACRPHNSGHHTIDACVSSQFEQQARIVAKLPLGSTELTQPVVMWNLLGDLWPSAEEQPNWDAIHQTPGAKLHLYGKKVAKDKRKMGHATFTAGTVEEALANAEKCRQHFNWA